MGDDTYPTHFVILPDTHPPPRGLIFHACLPPLLNRHFLHVSHTLPVHTVHRYPRFFVAHPHHYPQEQQ